MPVFYQSPGGREISSFSQSQAGEVTFCAFKYASSRIRGLRRKKDAPNMHFGRHVETAMRHLERTGTSAVAEFERIWTSDPVQKALAKVEFKAWGSPETFLQAGKDLLTLWTAKKSSYGIRRPEFYTYEERLSVKGFLDDSPFEAIPDIIDWPADHPTYGPGPRIIDVKCLDQKVNTRMPGTGQELPGIARLDMQLRIYSYASDIRRVALLPLFKGSPANPKVGDWRILRSPVEVPLEEGGSAVFSVGHSVAAAEPLPYLDNPQDLESIAKENADIEKKNKKLREAAKKEGKAFVETGDGRIAAMPLSALANVSIRLIEGYVSKAEADSAIEVMREAARATARMWARYEDLRKPILAAKDSLTFEAYEAALKDALKIAFPQRPGIRFPDARCQWCEYVGECLDVPEISAEKLIRIEDTWMLDFQDDDAE